MIAPQPPPRLTDRKRDAIVQAAIGEFREHGFNGTSMDRAAAAADGSIRTVYNHFPSKEELSGAIVMLMWERSPPPTTPGQRKGAARAGGAGPGRLAACAPPWMFPTPRSNCRAWSRHL